jgi:glycosyltransferase involved in cell wall biosynthesis
MPQAPCLPVMNILQIISKNDRYGAQRIFLDQVATLHGMGHAVTVVVRGTEGFVTDSLRRLGITCHGIEMTGFKDILFLRQLVRNNAIDLIHTTLERAEYFGLILSWLTGRPIVSTMMVPRYHPSYRFMNHVIALAHNQAMLLNENGLRSGKVSVIRPGIDVGRFCLPDAGKRDSWGKKLQVDKFTMVFCHISSLLSRKAHAVSLDLIAECKKRGEKPLLVIIGDPLQGEYYESLLQRSTLLGIRENIYFTGWTSDVPEILSLSHFTLLPSEKEALGVVLMEGMAAGTPIIARAGEGGAELIEEFGSGFLYKPEAGAGVLAEQVIALKRNDAEFKDLAARCRLTAETDFSLRRFGERLVDVYKGCLSSA